MIHDRTYCNTELIIDDKTFRHCAFVDCNLIYQGGAVPSFMECTFTETRFSVEGAACATLGFLTSLFHADSPFLQDVIENTFQDIRRSHTADFAA